MKRLLGVLAVTWALGFVLLLPFCGWLFQCGCTWSWEGGVKHCNVMRPGVPHCPWCRYGDAAFAGVEILLLASQATGAILAWRRRGSLGALAVSSMAGYLVGGYLISLVWSHVAAYPYGPFSLPPSAATGTDCCSAGR